MMENKSSVALMDGILVINVFYSVDRDFHFPDIALSISVACLTVERENCELVVFCFIRKQQQ